MQTIVQYFILIPLASAFIIPIIGKRVKMAAPTVSLVALIGLVASSILAASSVSVNKALVYRVGDAASALGISMVIDPLSAFMLVIVNTIALIAAVYSIGYMEKYTDKWKFYTLFMLMTAGINGVLIAGDLFNLYVFLEVAAIAGYFLVAFGIEPEALEASFKYAVMGTMASVFILLGIALLYGYASTLNMADLAGVLAVAGQAKALKFVIILFVMGFGLKAALFPFHAWLPYAHSAAPAPVSAMLSGVSIKVLGIYALSRVLFNVMGITPAVSSILITLSVLSMIVASILAFGQSDIKRLFAYSSISQIGYIALGLGIGTPLAILGALFHLLNHSVFKSLLFMNSGAIEHMTGTRDLNKIRGVMVNSPVTGATTLTGALSICGIPPFGGFWSKLIIIIACIQANRPGLALTAAVISALTLAYYFKALTPALFGIGPEFKNKKVGPSMGVAMIVLAGICIISAGLLLPNAGNRLLKDAAAVLTGGKAYALSVSETIRHAPAPGYEK